MKHVWTILALIIACWCLAPLQVQATSIDCKNLGSDVNAYICTHSELLATEQAISERFSQLKKQCPADKKVLASWQQFWLRERSDCRNIEDALADDQHILQTCLTEHMHYRLQQLNEINQRCDLSAGAASYPFVDVDYLKRYSHQYLNKFVTVWGQMNPTSCHQPKAAPSVAMLIGANRKRDRFRVQFSGMSPFQRDWLCATLPSSHWKGMILHDQHGDYLYLTDLLGAALPVSE